MKKNRRTKEEYVDAIKNSYSIAEALRKLNLIDRGGNYRIIKRACKEYNIDISHFTGKVWNKGQFFGPKKKIEEILVKDSYYGSSKVKERLLSSGLKKHMCENCNRIEWENKKIPLELHHKNGIHTDNRIENLQLLCPNCHALTDNYRGRNRKKSVKVETS